MPLRFTIRSSDVERLQNLIDANPCPDKERSWMVYLEVSPSIATFSFTGQRVQYPVNGHRTGYARFPAFAIREAKRRSSDSKLSREMEMSIGDGWLRYLGSFSEDEIEVGYVQNPRSGRVHYTSDAELVALGEMLRDPSVLHPYMQEHIELANQGLEGLVYRSAAKFRSFGLMDDDVAPQVRLDAFVREAVQALKPRLLDRFDTLGIENLWKS